MKYIKTPTGDVFKYDDCEIFNEDFCDETEVFLNIEVQKLLANELFEQTGILVGNAEGGEDNG